MTELDERAPQRRTIPWYVAAAPLCVMVVIFALSSRSQLPNLDGGRDIQSVAGHFLVYALLSATLTLLFRSLGWGIVPAFVVAVLISALYGVSDEFHQSFVPNRDSDVHDLIVDCIGAVFGSLLMNMLVETRRHRASASSDADRDPPAAGNS
ncbi:MAG: VanZ family protein [Thermomicrobiales bacterium]|nr:VanZ family protein [Thermomicrobiales bacterium]